MLGFVIVKCGMLALPSATAVEAIQADINARSVILTVRR